MDPLARALHLVERMSSLSPIIALSALLLSTVAPDCDCDEDSPRENRIEDRAERRENRVEDRQERREEIRDTLTPDMN